MHGGEEKCIQDLVQKAEGKRPHGRPMHKWEGNIKLDFNRMGECDWIYLAQDRDKSKLFQT
jgi:hypothetical protein